MSTDFLDGSDVKTYVDERYRITVYYNREYGEVFDLQNDPGEINNLWHRPEYAELKADLVMKLLFAEMGEGALGCPEPRVAAPRKGLKKVRNLYACF